ncbi:MAG: hypothetical protein Q7T87_07060 [Polaromonas sp.]|nr:hypothetical protein [Polaromonas sp.]
MASLFNPTPEGIVYQERHTALLRALIAAVGLTAILASFIFITLIRATGWPATGAQWGGVAASLLGIAAFCLFGGYCLRMAFHLTRQKIVFDRRLQRLLVDTHSLAEGHRQLILPFGDITGLSVVEHRPEDGASTFAIALALRSHAPLEMGGFNRRDRAQEQLQALRRLSNGPLSD